jgi:ferritin-like metal-binding protein YciE
MVKAARSPELKGVFEKHRETGEPHCAAGKGLYHDRQEASGQDVRGHCGITDEGAEIMKQYKGASTLDPGILAAAQTVGPHEISRYGTHPVPGCIAKRVWYGGPRL